MQKNHNKTEPVLAISKNKYRQIFENANEAIFLDQSGSIIFANKNFRILEFEESELAQISWLDFIYPEDGKELYPQKKRPDIPIILCTGFSEFMDKEKLRSSGINDVVLKPVLKSELAQTIRKAINDSQKRN